MEKNLWRLSKNGKFCYLYYGGYFFATPESNVKKTGDIINKDLSFPVVAGLFDSIDEYKSFLKELENKFPELNKGEIHNSLIKDMPIKAEGEWNVLKLSNKVSEFKIGGNVKSIIDDYQNEIDAQHEMRGLTKKEKADHDKVISFMRAKMWHNAWQKYQSMGAESKDYITNQAYNLINEKADYPLKSFKHGGNMQKSFNYTIGGL